jgi:hypothetical protein
MGSGKEGEEMTDITSPFPVPFLTQTQEAWDEYYRERAKKVPHERWREEAIEDMFRKLPFTAIVTVRDGEFTIDKHLSPQLPAWLNPEYILGDEFGVVAIFLERKVRS